MIRVLYCVFIVIIMMFESAVECNADSHRIYSKDFYRLIKTNQCPRCNLYKAPLSNINLTNADLAGANLRKADLRDATLYKANISGANLNHANLEGATWVDGTTCLKGSIGKCVKQ